MVDEVAVGQHVVAVVLEADSRGAEPHAVKTSESIHRAAKKQKHTAGAVSGRL